MRGISLDVGSAVGQISLKLLLLSKFKEKNINGGLIFSSAAFGLLWSIPSKFNISSLIRFYCFQV